MNKLLITGTDGFIGSCLAKHFLKYPINNYIIDCWDIRSKDTEIKYDKYNTIVHLGAVSETNASNSQEILKHNILFTQNLLLKTNKQCKIIYASSASVYGSATSSHAEHNILTLPKSKYAISKLLIDELILNFFYDRPIIGLRFFNVCSFYDESNKCQPSPTFSFLQQLKNTQTIKLFHGSSNILRDFIFIDDVIKIIKYFIKIPNIDESTIVNIGTGNALSFENIADALISKLQYGNKIYINKPNNLTSNYQEYTCANIDKLRNLGYNEYIPSIIEYIKNEHFS